MSRIGQYELLDRIAVGGMAEVFRGRAFGEEGFEKLVAIKRILPSYARDGRFVSMLQTEARIHASLSHRNIVQIHDLGVSQDGEYFIVLEYVDGPDLGALLTRLGERKAAARLPDPVALFIAVELAEGVHYAHELCSPDGAPLGLIHRDISPSNVLLSYAGEVKLSDFGLAKRTTDHSVMGSLKGKLTYMSPEQARRAPLDRQSDIFSLGAVLFELLTGHPLRQITDEVSGWQQVAAGQVPPARKFRADITPSLERLLNMALAPDPKDRFADARGFINEARAALEVLPRSRVGEAGELQAILRSVLPPGAPRPPKTPSKVVRLLSRMGAPGPDLPGPLAPAPAWQPVAASAPDPAADQITPPVAPGHSAAQPPPLPLAEPSVTMRRPTPAVLLPPPRPEERRSAAGLIAVTGGGAPPEKSARGSEEEARIIAAWPSLGFTGTPAASLVSGPIAGRGPPPAPVPVAFAERAPSSTDKAFPPGARRPASPMMAPVTPPAQTGRFIPVGRPPGPPPPAFAYAAPPIPRAQQKTSAGSSLIGGIFVVLVLGSALVGGALHFGVAPLPVLTEWWKPARLHIASDPPGAEVFLDGQRLSASTPTYTEVKRDRAMHVLELRRRGFQPERREIRYDRNVMLSVTSRLLPADPASAPEPAAPPPAAAAPVARPPAPTSPVAAAGKPGHRVAAAHRSKAGKRQAEKPRRKLRPRKKR